MRVEDLVDDLMQDLQDMQAKLQGILTVIRNETGRIGQSPEIKRENGRLTDAGVQFLRNMIERNVADSEIARTLDITPSAVHHQKHKYLAEKGRV